MRTQTKFTIKKIKNNTTMNQTKKEAFAIFKDKYCDLPFYETLLVSCNIGLFDKRLLKMGYDKDFIERARNQISKARDHWKSPQNVKFEIENRIMNDFPEIQQHNVVAIGDIYCNYVAEYFNHTRRILDIIESDGPNDYGGRFFNDKVEKILDIIVFRSNQMSRVPFYNNKTTRLQEKRDLE